VQSPHEDRSVAALFAELAGETTTLIRKEFELARAEVARNTARLGGGAVMLIGGVLAALLGIAALVACAILVLSRWLEPWLAALIVGAVTGTLGVVLVTAGWQRLKLRSLAPRRTLETLRQDRDWAREQLHERL
jgi:uncharacterized membrane protein YqjE